MEQTEAALAEAMELRDIFGPGNFYLELQDHGLANQKKVNPAIIEMARRTGIPLVCTNDTHYLRRDDNVAHDVLLCIGTGKIVDQPDRMRYESDQFYFKSYEEMKELWGEIPESLENTLRIAERCDLKIETEQPIPPFAVPPGYDADTYFEKTVRLGFEERRRYLQELAAAGQLKYPLKDYEERLSFEIEMIKRMKFSSYFLIVWDLIKFARDHAIPVGPGRGSVVGSLVAYSMRITEIDPLQYELFFERFLNPERIAPAGLSIWTSA